MEKHPAHKERISRSMSAPTPLPEPILPERAAALTVSRGAAWRQLLQFIAVGMSGAVVDLGLLTALKELAHLPTLPASSISFSLAMLNNFTWNYLWTFRHRRQGRLIVQFMKFMAFAVIGLALNGLTLMALEDPLGTLFHDPARGYLPAKVIASIVVLLWNYLANRLWNFRPRVQPADPGS
jgi:putative flippase GtrA